MTKESGADTLWMDQKLLQLLSWVALLLALLVVVGCEQGMPGGGTPEGALYIEKCSLCHPAPLPQKYTFKVWKGVILNMEEKVAATGTRDTLTEEEMESILNYFKKHSKRIM
ncbi:MAG: hypothetical protein ACE5D4_08715 [Thermodesulfobacteriota bacterium]